MNFFASLIKGRLAPYFAGLISVAYFLYIGFRGVGESTLQWLEQSRDLADDIAESPGVVTDWSAESHSLLEVIGAAVHVAVPGAAEWFLFGLSVLCGAIATGLVFVLARRLGGAVGGWMALFFMLTAAPWMGLFTRLDPTFFLVPVLLGFCAAWYANHLAWWQRCLWCVPLVAVGILLWPGVVVLAGLIWLVELLYSPKRRPSNSQGLIDAPTLSIDRLLIPVGALLVLCLYPLFWPNPIDGLAQYVLAALEQPASEFVFRSNAYPPARPPIYTGAAWIFEQLPLVVTAAFIAGILWCFVDLRSPQRRLAVGCAVGACALLAFPVLFRSPRPLGAEFGVLFFAMGLPVAIMVLCRFFSHALGRGAPSKKVRQVAIVTFLLGGISILIETPRAMESPESYRSPMTARILGWSATGDMPLRQDMLPLSLLDTPDSDEPVYLYSAGWEDHLEAYRRMHLLRDLETTADPDRADFAIRPVSPVAADRFSTYSASHLPPLEHAQTEVIPDIHRPLFLIDRRSDDRR